MRLRFSRLCLGGLTALLGACSAFEPKDGRYNPAHRSFEPSRAMRACATDQDCVLMDAECDQCCPGGAAVAKKMFEIAKKARTQICADRAKDLKPRECICVSAPVVCVDKLCTWDYQGPDPNAL